MTTSTITINNSNYINANVTGITVNMSIEEEANQFFNDGALTITLTAPNGVTTTLYSRPGDRGQNFINTTFSDSATKSIFQGPHRTVTVPPAAQSFGKSRWQPG